MIYVVKAGDTLSAIAKAYGVTVEALQEVNTISDPRRLQIGQELVIPQGGAMPKATATRVKAMPTTGPTATPNLVSVSWPRSVKKDKFRYYVTGPPWKMKSFDTLYGNKMVAKGDYLVIPFKVENIGEGTAYADNYYFRLRDAEGREFRIDISASILYELYRGIPTFSIEAIHSGSSVEGVLIYDVPPQSSVLELEMRGMSWEPSLFIALGAEIAAQPPTPIPPTPMPTHPPQPTPVTQPTRRVCCKICRKGKACGNSCISRDKTCHQPPGCACNE